MDTNIFNVKGVTVGTLDELTSSGFVRRIVITPQEGRSIELTLFSDDKEALEIETKKIVKI